MNIPGVCGGMLLTDSPDAEPPWQKKTSGSEAASDPEERHGYSSRLLWR